MSKILTVDLPGRAYDIEIERGLLDRVGERCKAVLPRAKALFVVTDSTVGPLYGQRVLDSLEKAGFCAVLHTVPAGEESKCVERLQELWEAMMAARLTRTDAVVALGGGVVGDLAGFSAATVLRGVDYIQIPTTLLAQVDSSVGGKVAIDLHAGKNLAGAFWQPKGVLIDPEVLTTLTDRTFSDGMAEVIKYGCIRDRAFFDKLAAWGGRAGVMEHIEEVIHTCCDIKRKVVLNDERDTGERMVLNFGHTIGHAFELARPLRDLDPRPRGGRRHVCSCPAGGTDGHHSRRNHRDHPEYIKGVPAAPHHSLSLGYPGGGGGPGQEERRQRHPPHRAGGAGKGRSPRHAP